MNPGGNALSGQSAQLAAGNPPPYAWGGPWQQMAVPAPNIQHFQAAGKGGSGVIVNRQGYVLTNHHVIHGARKITVTVSLTTASGQISKTYPAELIDEAPNLDFAVLKIITKGNEQFSPAPIGNSSVVSVGDEVLAIGSPYGLQQSVTLGMVSNTNRSMTVGNRVFNDFIQVDAAINPGSSGGALINVKGELIGLTTAIYSPTQAFSGIGFARPIDQAKAAFPDFIQTRTGVANALVGNMPAWWTAQTQQVANIQNANTQAKVWLGIRVRAVDKDVQSFLELPMGYGVLVMEVFEFSPCHAAGVLPGDVIIRADDRSIKDDNMLEKLLNNKDPGEKMKLTIFRDGTKKKLTPKLSDRPVGFNITPAAFGLGDGLEWLSPPFDGDPLLTAQPVALVAQALAGTNPATARQSLQANVLPSPRQQNAAGKKFIEGHWLGLEVITLTSELASQYQIPQGESGVLVDEVTLEAAESGILAGDIVLSVAGFPTPDLKSFFRATQREPVLEGTSAQLEISRRGRKKTFTMTARNAPILGFAQMEAAQPIQPSALRPHRYMGACTKCHIFMRTGGQLATDAGDILPSPPPITRNAKPPHRDRGSCAACHTLR